MALILKVVLWMKIRHTMDNALWTRSFVDTTKGYQLESCPRRQ